MKNIIKVIVWSIFGMISFVLVGVIDIAMLALACVNKCVRLAMWWILSLIDGDDEEDRQATRDITWWCVNMGYKEWVDELYPTEEDEP
jgi:hypothetical protein